MVIFLVFGSSGAGCGLVYTRGVLADYFIRMLRNMVLVICGFDSLSRVSECL